MKYVKRMKYDKIMDNMNKGAKRSAKKVKLSLKIIQNTFNIVELYVMKCSLLKYYKAISNSISIKLS